MSNEYKPELGQMIFGQPHQEYECPGYLRHALDVIQGALYRKLTPNRYGQVPDPFSNTGAQFKCPVFEVEAYSWGDEEQPYNFKYKDIEVSWYKHLRRGTSVNCKVTARESMNLLEDCLQEIERM